MSDDPKPFRLDMAPQPAPKLEERPSFVPLINAMGRHGIGKGGTDTTIGKFEALRQTHEWTGVIYPQQVTALKRNVMLLRGVDTVTLGIDTENKVVSCSLGPQLYPTQDPATVDRMMAEMVVAVLGEGWKISCDILKPREPARRQRSAPKRKGKGGSRRGTRR